MTAFGVWNDMITNVGEVKLPDSEFPPVPNWVTVTKHYDGSFDYCDVCGDDQNITKHHIFGRKEHPLLTMPLCWTCHKAVHNDGRSKLGTEEMIAALQELVPEYTIRKVAHRLPVRDKLRRGPRGGGGTCG